MNSLCVNSIRWTARLGRFLVLCLFGLGIASMASSTVYVAMNDSDLADGSQLILEGEIAERTSWGEDGRPQTRYRVNVTNVYKGAWDEPTVDVDLPGGRGDSGSLWWVTGTPNWQPGDRALLFLTPTAGGGWTLEQFFLGGFAVTFEDGAWVARRDLSQGHQLELPGSNSPVDGPRNFDAFTRWLQDRSQGVIRQPGYFLLDDSLSTATSGDESEDGTFEDHTTAAEEIAADGASAAGTSKSTPAKFSSLLSPTDDWPLGCGTNGGHSLRWFQFESGAAVPWRSHFTGQGGLPGRGVEELQRALEAWQQAPDTIIDLVYEGITTQQAGLRGNDGSNVVLFEDPNDEIGGTWQGSGVLALGGPWFNCSLSPHRGGNFHQVLEADIVLQDGLTGFFQNLIQPGLAAEEIFGHELGHTLGLAHSTVAESLMSPQLHNDGRGASLSADDHAALLYLYGIDDEPPPERPRALQAEVLNGLRVKLTWLDFSDNESGFRIERRRRGQPYQSVGTTPSDVTLWVDDAIQPGIEYSYRIRAHNSGGPSNSSNRVIVFSPIGHAPFAPTLLRAAPLSYERVQLTWQDNADNETNYVLEILIPGSSDWLRAPFLGAPNTTALVVTGLDSGQRYGFRVIASNDFGASQTSNVAWIQTIPQSSLCQVDSDTLCLLQGRFQIEAEFVNSGDSVIQAAHGVPSTDHTGFFWFFQPGNFELVVKMVDGQHVNGAYWVFFDGITDLEFRLRITDTVTGRQRVYENPAGEICGRSDTQAFVFSDDAAVAPSLIGKDQSDRQPLSPDEIKNFLRRLTLEPLDPQAQESAAKPLRAPLAIPASGNSKANAAMSCLPSTHTLCLLDGRLSITVNFSDPHNSNREGRGQAIQGTSQSGQFWFFQLDSSELVVKAIDGSQSNGNLWLFLGSLTDVAFTLNATDTLTGEEKTYYNPAGQVCGQVDLDAFSGVILGNIP